MPDLTEYARKRYRGKTIYRANALSKFRQITKLVGKGKQVLDIACGDRTLTKMLEKHNSVWGIEITDVDLQKDELPFPSDFFNVVVASEIIEHIWDCDRFLREIKSVLKVDGTLIISTPNLASLGRRLLLLTGRNPYVENFLYPYEAGHVKHFVRKDFKYLLEKNGFKVKQLLSDVIILFNNGVIYSRLFAKIFPQLGRSIIAVCGC